MCELVIYLDDCHRGVKMHGNKNKRSKKERKILQMPIRSSPQK